MSKTRTRKWQVAAAVILFISGAQLSPSTASCDNTEEAKSAYAKGTELFKGEDYAQAAESFRLANRLNPNWKIFYNIGQCEVLAKRYGLALDAFESYVAQGGDDIPDPRRDEVLQEIDRLRKIVGMLDLQAPDGAIVFIDDLERGTAPLPGPLKLAAGMDHHLEVRIGEEAILARTIRVSGGQTIAVVATREDDSPSSEKEDEVELSEHPAAEPSSSLVKTLGWVAFGVGGAAAIGGAVTGGMALSINGDLEKSCPDLQCDDDDWKEAGRMENLATATNVLLIAGGTIAAAGITMLIIDAASNREDMEETSDTAVLPALGPGYAGLSLTGRF